MRTPIRCFGMAMRVEMDLFAFICYFDPTKVVVGERNVADRETKLLVSTKGRTIPLTPPALAASGDSGDSIDKLFDEGNDVEQERSTEKGDDVLEETIATDVLEIRLREDFHAATSDIGGKSLAVLRGLVPEDSSVSELNLQARPLVARSSVLDAPVVTVVATTTIAVDVSAILPPQVRVVSGRSASVGKAKKNVASTSKLDEPTTSSDSFYAAAARQMCVEAEKDAEIAHLRSLLSLKEYEAAEAIRLREQVSVVEVAATVKGDELRGLKERNFVLEGEKDLLSERAMTLESVTALKETKVVSLEFERGGLVNQISLLESAFELFKQQMEAMQDEQATALRNRVMELDAKLLEMAAHLEEEFYPRFLVTISGRWWILTHGLKLDGLKAGVDHRKAGRDLSVIEAYDPSEESISIDAVNALGAVDFSFLTKLESKKDASMVDLMDSLRLEGPLAEIPEVEDLQPP
ncbi:hypothetical protein Tco_1269293 [Tanacetum coccineum]